MLDTDYFIGRGLLICEEQVQNQTAHCLWMSDEDSGWQLDCESFQPDSEG